MNKLLIALLSLTLIFAFYLALQGQLSRDGSAAGLVEGKLSPCPASPNCVCSEYGDDSSHYSTPLSALNQAATLAQLTTILRQLGGQVDSARDNYLAASFPSPLFGFVDDVELRFDPVKQVIHIRSASRVGYSDLGANQDRVESIRQRYRQLQDS